MDVMATGMRGFLQKMRDTQPGLYQRVLPQLVAYAPQIWSDHVQSVRGATLGLLAQDDDDDETPDYSAPAVVPDLTGAGPDLDSALDDLDVPDVDTAADVANTGSTDTTLTNTVSNIVNSTLASVPSDLAAVVGQQIDTDLGNASQGLAPSATTAPSAFSTLSSGLGTTGMLLVGGGVLLLVALAAAG